MSKGGRGKGKNNNRTADRNPLPEVAPFEYVDPKARERAARVEEAIPDPPTPPGMIAPPRFRNRNKGERKVRASSIVRNPKNFRTHPEYQQQAVATILDRIGFVGKLLVRELPDGRFELIDGHLRSDLMGEDEVEVIVTDLTEAEADELLAVYDKTAALAIPDHDKLRDLLAGLDAAGTPLLDMGYPEWELQQLLPVSFTPGPAAGGEGGGAPGEAGPPSGEPPAVAHVCPNCGFALGGAK